MPDRKKEEAKEKQRTIQKEQRAQKRMGRVCYKRTNGAGDMEKMGLHIEKLKFTRKEGEMENIIL